MSNFGIILTQVYASHHSMSPLKIFFEHDIHNQKFVTLEF